MTILADIREWVFVLRCWWCLKVIQYNHLIIRKFFDYLIYNNK